MIPPGGSKRTETPNYRVISIYIHLTIGVFGKLVFTTGNRKNLSKRDRAYSTATGCTGRHVSQTDRFRTKYSGLHLSRNEGEADFEYGVPLDHYILDCKNQLTLTHPENKIKLV